MRLYLVSPFLNNGIFQWQGTKDMSSFLSIPSAIHFIESNNWKENHKISKELILEVSEDLKNLFGTNPLFKSEDWVGQMVSHPLPSNTPENLKEMLWEKFLIEVPVFEWKKQKYIRVSAHFRIHTKKLVNMKVKKNQFWL